jgi:hypothetical protein
MKKYLLLLVFVFLVSCSEDEDKKDVLTFNGTETYVFVSEVEDIQVYDINGKVSDPMLWDSSLVEAKLELDTDLVYNYTEFTINDNFLYLSDGNETETIPIIIEGNEIFSNIEELGLRIKIFNVLEDGSLENFAVLYFYKDENTTYSESTNFSYSEYDEQFNEAKSSISDGAFAALIKQKRKYSKAN